jgi:hypothetical protein
MSLHSIRSARRRFACPRVIALSLPLVIAALSLGLGHLPGPGVEWVRRRRSIRESADWRRESDGAEDRGRAADRDFAVTPVIVLVRC